jgi:hypothetical protein
MISSTENLIDRVLTEHGVLSRQDIIRDEIINGLFKAFAHDGISCQNISSSIGNFNRHGFLRRLQSSSETSSGESGSQFVLNIILVFVCLICAGLASGLTQGLLSLDITEMTIKSRSGTPIEKKYADKVLPIIKRHHLL